MIAKPLVLGLLALTLASCDHLERSAGAAPAKMAGQESLAELIPARARVAAILRKNAIAPLRDLLTNDPDMMRELQPYLERMIGIDLTRIEGAAVFVTDTVSVEGHIAMILRIPAGGSALKLPSIGDAGGTPLYRLEKDVVLARTKSGIVLGSETEVRAVVAVERGREPALPRDAGLGKLLATDVGDVDFVLAVGPGALPPDKTMGVEDGLLMVRHSGSFELALHGDPAQLQNLRGMAMGGIQLALSSMTQEKDKVLAGTDPWAGVGAILAYYKAKKLAVELEPKLEGNALVVRYKLPDTTQLAGPSMIIAFGGVGAAVAVPAFMKYIRRSKTVEATMNLRRLSDALSALQIEAPKKLATIRSTEWTPKNSCCGQPGEKCAPDPKAWQGAPWKMLGFSVDDPHYYQYRVRTEGKGQAAKIFVEARGDLDCDGQFSLFRRTVGAGEGGLFSENDIE